MNYKEKFLKIFKSLINSKAQAPTNINNSVSISEIQTVKIENTIPQIPINSETEMVTNIEDDYEITKWLKNGVLHNENGPALIKKHIKYNYTEEIEWYIDGKLHRDNEPARIYKMNSYSGEDKLYYQHGLLHREGGPASITDRCESWYINGVLHREDGPAILHSDGDYTWYKNGKIHREGGPAVYVDDGFIEQYYINGLEHREDGPALISEHGNHHEYWIEGKKHRLDGPAYFNLDGSYEEWWINGIECTEKVLSSLQLHDELRSEINNENQVEQIKSKKLKV